VAGLEWRGTSTPAARARGVAWAPRSHGAHPRRRGTKRGSCLVGAAERNAALVLVGRRGSRLHFMRRDSDNSCAPRLIQAQRRVTQEPRVSFRMRGPPAPALPRGPRWPGGPWCGPWCGPGRATRTRAAPRHTSLAQEPRVRNEETLQGLDTRRSTADTALQLYSAVRVYQRTDTALQLYSAVRVYQRTDTALQLYSAVRAVQDPFMCRASA
jgi:hypothetical protein